MTPAERAVLARYPDAECWRLRLGENSYRVYDFGHTAAPCIGTGPTPTEAWADAAARLDAKEET